MADEPKIVVNGREYPIPDSFTMGEYADMEKITGQGYDLAKGGYLSTMALVYIAMKRVDPRADLEVIRNLREEDLEWKVPDEIPPATGAQNGSENVSAPASSKTSETDSALSPDEIPVRTGTKS